MERKQWEVRNGALEHLSPGLSLIMLKPKNPINESVIPAVIVFV